jgi:hypothetical protein
MGVSLRSDRRSDLIKFTVKVDIQEIRRIYTRAWQDIARSFLEDVAERMRDMMRGPKSGRTYRGHRASAPGEAPAVLTGALIGSIGEPVISGMTARLVISDPKARFLDPQEGDPQHPFIEPRPFVMPAIEGALAQLEKGGVIGNL